ncbi:MAG TPA: zinc-binding alcohol dehydrogenase [Chloroflexi bacterium]|jgi:3-hydroxyethyl bacteriochlorophyllide a dehydrogenase|nr:zinc-binding alcohol dehydrogenase [Chloroflexota bacterium]
MTNRRVPAVVFPAPEQVEVRDIDLPPVGPGDVRVRSRVTAVSAGTELMVLRGTFPNQGYPCVMGYQQVGIVEEVGDEVGDRRSGDLPITDLVIGDRVVTSQARLPAGYYSGSGMAHAGALVAPADACVRVPDGVSDEAAVCTIMVAVALLGYQKCGHLAEQRVAVTGLGLIGQFAAQVWRSGGNVVRAGDLRALRVNLASRYSADGGFCGDIESFDAWLRQDWPDGADVLVETSGVSRVFDAALALPRAHGVVCVQGHYPYDLSFSFRTAHWKQLRFEFPCAWGGVPNMRRALGMMATEQVVVEPLITHRLPYTQAPEAYRALLAGDEEMLGLVFRWDET